MRRGFLGNSKKYVQDSQPKDPLANGNPSDLMQSRRIAEMDATIKVETDYTVIWQEEDSGLILQSDYRFESPYFGYFPAGSSAPEMVYIDDDVTQVEDAFDWPVWKQPALKPIPHNERCFRIHEARGKGLAMVANRAIKKGECIFTERPFYVSVQTKAIAPDMGVKSGGGFHRNATSRLGEKACRALLDLSNCYKEDEMDEIPGKLGTNYLPVDVAPTQNEKKKYGGAFQTLSRANHSCAPNAK